LHKEFRIKTKDFGEIEVKEEDIIHFTRGLYGFDDYNKYVILKDEPEDTVMFLQSLDDTDLSFVLVDPYAILSNYNPVLQKEDLDDLDVHNETELKYLVIAIIRENIKESVVNLKSPIAINPASRKAKQVILQNSYPLRYAIIATEEGEEC